MVPNRLFLTKGVGKHPEQLASFEWALRDAGIAHCNLVNVSSIVPPRCSLIARAEGVSLLAPGQITYAVLARNGTCEPHRLLAASVGLALPARPEMHGYVSEHHSFGQTGEAAGDYAEDLAATMLATTMGLAFDPNAAWDEKKQLFRASDLIIKTSNTTQSATGDKRGLWTTVVAAAVFLLPG